MSWLFSRALVAASLEEGSLDGEPSAPSNSTDTPQAYLWPAKTTERSRRSRSGTTCKPLTDDLGGAVLMWCLEASPAKTYPSREKAQVLTESEVGYGGKWRELSVKYDPDSSSWRTHRALFDLDLSESSVTLPQWGMMRGGALLERTTSALPTNEIGSGSWATPCASDATRGGKITEKMSGRSLAQQINTPHRCPTPTVYGNHNRKGLTKNSGDGLSTWVKKVPTPTACAAKGSSPGSLTRRSGRSRVNDRLDHHVMSSDGGPLNPTWVEWLMGWPLGWTELKPLETGKFQAWLRSHGKY